MRGPTDNKMRVPLLLAGALLTLLAYQPALGSESSALARSFEAALVDAVEEVQRAVVTLEVHGSSSASEGLPPGMERFFPIDGLGSGFIIDSKGTLITNHHVINGADRIDVVLFDGRQFKAKVVASDPSSDVGVARIVDPPSDLPVAQLGDSDGLRVGQFGIAVGAPLGYERSVTFGHISALHRSAIGERAPGMIAPGFEELTLQDFIQVDTAINPGNSGGPLVNLDGQVIGVNAAIMAAPGGGLGFSIPINLAMSVAEQLMTKGTVARGWLGVRMSDNNPAQADAFDLPTSQGALIVEIFEGSPASRAKLEEDDLVVRFQDRVIRSSRDLLSAVSVSEMGKPVSMTVWRQERGKNLQRTIKVVLTERPAKFSGGEAGPTRAVVPDKAKAPEKADKDRVFLLRGLGIELVPAAGTRRAGLSVASVLGRSLAADAGVRKGDVILEVGGEQVATVKQVGDQLRRAERPFVSLVVQREGKKRYLSIEVPR